MTNTKDAYSAGTQLSGKEQSLSDLLPKTQPVIDAMKEEDIDVGTHTRKSVTEDIVNKADIIIDMAEPETVQSFVKEHPHRIIWSIDDPKGTSLQEHIRIKNEIKGKIQSFRE